jgi:hypothetical protein
VDGGGVTATPGQRRRHDKMQEGAADSGAWSSSSIASRQGEGRRLEGRGARCDGDLRSRTSALNRCKIESRRGSGRCASSRRRG